MSPTIRLPTDPQWQDVGVLSASGDLILNRRRVLALALLGPAAAAAFTVACGRSGSPEPDPLEEQLTAARRDADLAAAAAKAAPPPAVPALTVLAAERSRHAAALVEELARAAGKPTPTQSEAPSSQAQTPTARPGPPPGVDDVTKALRESAASAAKLAPTLSGYRAGLLGSIAAACATSLAVGFTPAERHR